MVVEFGGLVSAIGLIVVVVGALIARDRQITNMIHTNHDENQTAVSASSKLAADNDKELHSRVNRLREHSDKEFVRRADLDGHLQRIEKRVDLIHSEMREERRETNSRLDVILATLGKSNDR